MAVETPNHSEDILPIENRASFLDRVSGWSRENQLRIISIYNLTKYAHRDQLRDDGTRYFEHPRSATIIAFDELNLGEEDHVVIETIIGHDVPEDQYIFGNSILGTYEENKEITRFMVGRILDMEVAENFISISKPVGWDIDNLPHDVIDSMYHDNLWAASVETIVAKGCDRLHNLRTLKSTTPEKQKRKIIETREVYLPLFKAKFKGSKYEKVGNILISKIEEEIKALESSN